MAFARSVRVRKIGRRCRNP